MSYRLYNSGNVLVFVDTAYTNKNGGTQFWTQKLPRNKTWYSYDNTAAPILYSVYYDEPERDLIIDQQYGEFQDKDGNGFANDAALIAYLDKILGLVDKSFLAITKGDVYGHSVVNNIGRNPLIASGTTAEIWDGLIAYVFPDTALITSISQTADQVAMRGATIEVQGLDTSWNATTQNVTLDAANTTTVVTLTTPLLRVFMAKVQANVVSDSPIRIHNAGETVDYAIIDIGNNQTLMAIYTVPAGKTAYMTTLFTSINPATNQDPTAMSVRLWARDNANGYAAQVKHIFGLITGDHHHTYLPYRAFTEKTDIFIDASPVGKAADVTAGFELILIDD